jgi:phosphatidate cytidylyltransferase
MRRILTAAVLVPVLLAVIKLAPPWAFNAVFAVGIALGALEAYRMLQQDGRRPFVILGVLATLAIAWSFGGLPPQVPARFPLVGLVGLTWLAALALRPDPRAMFAAVSDALVPVIAVGLPLSFLVALRAVSDPLGEDLLLLLIVAVAFGDTAAFYVGSRFGRRRLAPSVSPKKSWEGALGGIAGALGGALLASFWFYQRLPVGHAVVLGVLLGALGILGDLSESMLKRAVGAKDASRLLPGHGGLLDRMDSLLLSAPALYGYWYAFLREVP